MLAVLIGACFPQVLLGLESFVYGDADQFAYPVAFHLRESFWRGEIPLWNPLSSCGLPFLAQWNTMALYPPSLFYLLFPMPWSFGVFCLAHLFWAGLGMYFLAHRWTAHRLAAAVAGGAFAFNGLMWYGLMWPHLVAALAWMPWVILTTERAWRNGGRALILAALVGAMQMLSGGAEAILQTWMVIGLFWASDWLRPASLLSNRGAAAPTGPSAAESNRHDARDLSQPRGAMVWRLTVVALWVAGLAAAQLLPFLELIQHSQRNASYRASAVPTIASMPWTGWANYLVPLFHCQRNSQGVYGQAGQSWLGSYYLGVGIVALALVAVWRSRRRQVWLLAGLAGFGFLMAVGEHGPVYAWGKAVLPGVRFMRFPVKFVMSMTFALPLLAAHGVAWLSELPAARWAREKRFLKGLVLGVILLAGLIVCDAWLFPLDRSEGRTVSANAGVRLLFLLLGLGVIGWLRGSLETKTRHFLETGLIALLWFDVFTHAPNLSPTAPGSVLEPNLARDCFKWDRELLPGGSRAMQSKDTFWRMLSGGSDNMELDAKARRLTLSMNNNLLDAVPKLDGFYSSDLKEYYEVFAWLYFKTNPAEGLKDFLGVSHVGYLSNTMAWPTRPSALPLITAGQQPVFADESEALQALVSDSFAPLRAVYLPLEARGRLAASGAARARVVSSRFAAHQVEAEVEADAPSLMVVAQSYYPAWEARVDGRPTRLWRADHAFQAVEVPAGRHQVSLAYRDSPFHWGAGVSLLSLLACAAGLKREVKP